MNEKNIPVIGWLVCIDGPDKGKDYHIVNTPVGNGIGTDESMAVVVKDDPDVAPINHAVIRFDEQFGKCVLSQGVGKRIVRLNGAIVFGPTYLKPFDRIVIGKSEYLFMPYGGNVDPSNTWMKVKNKQPITDILSEMKDCATNPCVGWLVDRGMERNGVAYRLTADFNYIGTDASMDICVAPDNSIANEYHAAIVYDSKDNSYFFVPIAMSSGYFINGMPINGVVPLQGFEEISMGVTRVCFVPICGEYFRW